MSYQFTVQFRFNRQFHLQINKDMIKDKCYVCRINNNVYMTFLRHIGVEGKFEVQKKMKLRFISDMFYGKNCKLMCFSLQKMLTETD